MGEPYEVITQDSLNQRTTHNYLLLHESDTLVQQLLFDKNETCRAVTYDLKIDTHQSEWVEITKGYKRVGDLMISPNRFLVSTLKQ